MTMFTGSAFRHEGVPIPDEITSGSEFTVTLMEGPGYLTLERKRNANGFYTFPSSFAAHSSSNMVSSVFSPYIIGSYMGPQQSGSLTFTAAHDIGADTIFVKVASTITDIQVDMGGGTEESFIITVKTDNTGTSNNDQFTLPWTGTYDVDWGDGNTETSVVDTQTHTYASAGTYDVKVTAATGRIEFNNGGDALKLLDIKNWGTCAWTDVNNAFRGCVSLTGITATDAPNLINVTSFIMTFWKCRLLNADFSHWDVSSITSTDRMFSAGGANGTINLSNWDVSNVTNMYATFYDCTNLVPIGVEDWDTQSVLNAQQMFNNTQLFNQSLANWDINQVTNFYNFMNNVNSLSTSNYDATLISWAAQNPQNGISISFGTSQYSYEAAAARQTLIDTYGWTITDGGQVASPEFALKWETTTPNEEIQIGVGSGTFNYDIDWGDGTVETYTTDANVSHTYVAAGDHITKITGDFPHLNMKNLTDDVYREKLRDVLNWGSIVWQDWTNMFRDCNGFTGLTATDLPNLLNVTSFHYFAAASNFGNHYNSTVQNWNVSSVTNMSNFSYYGSWRNKISTWDTSNVTNFSNFLRSNSAFDNGTDLVDMDNLDVSSAINMDWMLNRATRMANIYIGSWDVSNVTTFNTFSNPLDISNSGIENWDVSNASNFNQFNAYAQQTDVSFANWTPVNMTSALQFMFNNSAMSTANYDATLISWAAQSLQSNVSINFGNAQYTLGGAAEAARNTLINTYGWTITDGGGIFVGLLDTYTGAAAAYSLRDLASASLGSAVVRVRRSSDNTEQDFTATEITDGTLTTFTGAGDGFVTTWYDQSGNGVNAIQATASQQPKIVSSGVVELDNGKPCIIWDNTNDTMRITTSYSGNNLLSIFSVYNKTTPNPSDDSAYLVYADASLNVPDGVLAWRYQGQIGTYRSGVHSVNGSIPYDTQVNSNFIYTSTQVDFYNNSSLIGSKTSSNAIANFNYTFIQIGRSGGNTSFKNQELIIYQSDQSSNRTGIETDINNEYTIY